MNFKQYFTESSIPPGMLEIEDITNDGLIGDEDVIKAWQIIRHYPHSENEDIFYLSLDKDGKYFLTDFDGDELNQHYYDRIVPVVMSWELKRNLSPQTKETFGDIVDEL